MEKPGAPPAPPAPPAGIDIRDANGTRVIINQNGVIVRDGSKSASKQKNKDKNKDTDTDF
jgi:type II secretory pathway component PulC